MQVCRKARNYVNSSLRADDLFLTLATRPTIERAPAGPRSDEVTFYLSGGGNAKSLLADPPVGRDVHEVAGPRVETFILEAKLRCPLKQRDPFVLFLVVPVCFWERVPLCHDPLDANALGLMEPDEKFVGSFSGNGEKIHGSVADAGDDFEAGGVVVGALPDDPTSETVSGNSGRVMLRGGSIGKRMILRNGRTLDYSGGVIGEAFQARRGVRSPSGADNS